MKNATLIGLLLMGSACANADVTRHPLPNNSTFPISQAVEVSADTTIIYHSGTLPNPANPDADPNSREYWGDTEAQAESVFQNMATSFEKLGVDFGDIVKMTVFLVGDPEMDGRMDFGGFMRSYSKYFGTEWISAASCGVIPSTSVLRPSQTNQPVLHFRSPDWPGPESTSRLRW
jgi:enamine deaminase RidA (YjgF/YER057c/UK114 family)